jgi:hypothetical protein
VTRGAHPFRLSTAGMTETQRAQWWAAGGGRASCKGTGAKVGDQRECIKCGLEFTVTPVHVKDRWYICSVCRRARRAKSA